MSIKTESNILSLAKLREIHSEYVKVASRNECFKLEFYPMMTDMHSGKYKIKISIVVSELNTNKRKKFIESYINALDLATIVDLIQRNQFKSEKFFGGGTEGSQKICRITSFEYKEDGTLAITVQKCPGERNQDGGYLPIGKPLDSISIYLKGFPLQRTLYRLKTYIENKMILDFRKYEYAPVDDRLKNQVK